MKFLDQVRIKINSGHGGPGKVSFRREAMTPRGGPDGGDGGRGGDVIFRASTGLNSLLDYRQGKSYSAKDGNPGEGANCSGAKGDDLILVVPVGTQVKNEAGEVLLDLIQVGDTVVLKGGRGGKGNAFFKTSVNQAPEHAQPGEDGQSLEVRLELKLIADVGIVGFPNAGKSTLISRISSAKPKIADYPFTTLVPNLGVVRMGDLQSFVVADIPGLIKGAHLGVGLGIQFLKHIERTKFFIHLVDISPFSQQPLEDYDAINEELEKYDQSQVAEPGFFPLSNRTQIVVLNKIDACPPGLLEERKAAFKEKLGYEPFCISAVSGLNIEALKWKIWQTLSREET
jgi:GTPase